MKKVFSLVLALAVCLAAVGYAEGAAYVPGTYSASSAGFHSDVTVTVTVDETSITEVTLDVSGETEGIGARPRETPWPARFWRPRAPKSMA